MQGMKTGVLALALMMSAGASAVEPELGAENFLSEVNNNAHVGGPYAQRYAQVFELHDTGELSHLMLPIACDSWATLVAMIEEAPAGIPNGNVLASQAVPGYVLDAVQWSNVTAAMRMVEFTRPAFLPPGRYAFTLGVKGKGSCGLWRAPEGSPYAYYAYQRASNLPAGWQLLHDGSGNPQHLAFQVFQRPQ